MKKKIGLIGNNISYSISPIIHNYWINKLSINAIYNLIDISKDQFNKKKIHAYINEGYIGFNITIPYKEKILLLIENISKVANEIKAANTVYIYNNMIIATNTDCYGFLYSLIININYNKSPKNTISLKDLYNQNNLKDNKKTIFLFEENIKVLIIGAGGAAKAVIYALLKTNVEKIYIINRTYEKILSLKKIFKSSKIEIVTNLNEISNISLVVNCIPIENNNYFNFECTNILNSNCIFYDLIYSPIKTNFLLHAESCGYKIINGTQMLVIQAAFSFYKWFNIMPNIDKDLINLVNNVILNNNKYDNYRYNR